MIAQNLNPRLIADFFLARDNERETADVTQLKLHKLCYLAQANYLAETGVRLFDSEFYAFQYGPVVADILADFKSYDRQTIVATESGRRRAEEAALSSLPPEIVTYLDRVWNTYKDESSSRLVNLTHDDAPWSDAFIPGVPHCRMRDEAIRDWYRNKPEAERIYVDNVWFVPTEVWDALEADE